MLGQIYEHAGDKSGAENAFRQALDDAHKAQGNLGEDALDMMRLAAMRLSRLYRSMDRDAEADALAKEVKIELDLAALAAQE